MGSLEGKTSWGEGDFERKLFGWTKPPHILKLNGTEGKKKMVDELWQSKARKTGMREIPSVRRTGTNQVICYKSSYLSLPLRESILPSSLRKLPKAHNSWNVTHDHNHITSKQICHLLLFCMLHQQGMNLTTRWSYLEHHFQEERVFCLSCIHDSFQLCWRKLLSPQSQNFL